MSQKRFLSTILAGAVMASGFSITPLALADDELRVDDDGVQCPGAFPTIQAAVTAAAGMPGKQKVKICQGTYTENVTIGPSNPLEIVGDGIEKVTVRPVPGTPGPAFDALNSGTVDIKKLTIDGQSALTGNPLGIRYQQTSGEIKELAVVNVRDAAGVGQSVGIRVNSTGPAVKAKVKDSLVQNWTRVGVLGNGPGVEIEIVGLTLVGPTPPKVWAPNGVQISRGAIGSVKENTISGASIGIVPPNAGSGILLFCAGPTKVEGNRISNSDTGVNLEDNANATVKGNKVSGSLFDAYPLLSGVAVFFGLTDPFPVGCPGGVQATVNNRFEDNEAKNSTRDGVHLEGFAAQPGPSNNRIHETEIKQSGRNGIRVFGANGGAGNFFTKNEIKTSVEHDARDDTSGTGTAGTANTWKKNECKTSQPSGLCKNDD